SRWSWTPRRTTGREGNDPDQGSDIPDRSDLTQPGKGKARASAGPARRRTGRSSSANRPTPSAEAVGKAFRPASAPSPGGGAMVRVNHRGEGIDAADTLEGARGIVQRQSRCCQSWYQENGEFRPQRLSPSSS